MDLDEITRVSSRPLPPVAISTHDRPVQCRTAGEGLHPKLISPFSHLPCAWFGNGFKVPWQIAVM